MGATNAAIQRAVTGYVALPEAVSEARYTEARASKGPTTTPMATAT